MSFEEIFSRRKLVSGAVSTLAIPAFLRSAPQNRNRLLKVAGRPDSVVAFMEDGSIPLKANGTSWQGRGMDVETAAQKGGVAVMLRAAKSPVLRIHLRWQVEAAPDLQYLGDAWERSYGDLSWRSLEPERVMPWYFLTFDGRSSAACGVKTGAGALCFWQVDPAGVSLWLDVRNGGRGLQLGNRELHAASIVAEEYPDTKPFAAARKFCHRLCEAPRLPASPVYGGNNWYYAYGHSSAADIRDDSQRISSFAGSNENRPFMVIDDGWQPNPTAGPWNRGNARFPDMAALASEMKRIGVRTGLWMRPLFTKEEIPAGWRLQSPNAARANTKKAYTIDPTVPEAMAKVQHDMKTAVGWGYEMIKHDFSTYDLLGRWGKDMGANVTVSGWSFADRSRTNAEVIRDFYRGLREAAGNAMLLGCNTVGHLSAGLFEMQRTGDDTSGRDWNRTRKMGVNTLAFRAPQQGAFFTVDADCVGLTKQIPWNLNRQWLDLLARSGTSLFVSVAPDAVEPEQRKTLERAFEIASKPVELGQPTDWLWNTEPEDWVLQGERITYRWFGEEGVNPFSN